MTESKEKLEKIAARIRALLAKTVANGCTEGEAIAAAAKAAELLSAHDLSEDDVQDRKDTFEFSDHPVDDMVDEALWRVAGAISQLCQVRNWLDDSRGVKKRFLRFFGLAVDVEIAGYLLSISERALRQATDDYADGIKLRSRTNPSWGTRKLRTFVDAMATRLAEKIREIAWMRKREGTGAGLVVVKDALIREEMSKRDIKLEDARQRDHDCGSLEGLAGRLAAEGVRFENAVGEARPGQVALIGRG